MHARAATKNCMKEAEKAREQGRPRPKGDVYAWEAIARVAEVC